MQQGEPVAGFNTQVPEKEIYPCLRNPHDIFIIGITPIGLNAPPMVIAINHQAVAFKIGINAYPDFIIFKSV